MGRLGRPLAAGDFGVTPDMATLAKGIANGIPMGAVLLGDRIAAKIKTGRSGLDVRRRAGRLRRPSGRAGDDRAGESRRPRQDAWRGDAPSSFASGRSRRSSAAAAWSGCAVRGDAKALHRRLMERGFITGTERQPAGAAADAADQHAAGTRCRNWPSR